MQPVPNPFPDDLTIGLQVGRGWRSRVYAGTWRGEAVVVKRYMPEAIRKYRRRYRVSIAQFEHDRNAAFVGVAALRPFAARPIAWSGGTTDDRRREGACFVQQRIEGTDLCELLNESRRLPTDLLAAIEHVVATAWRHGLYDIDMSPSNFRMVAGENGWRPVLFDFNLMPQHLYAPNPLVALLYRTGLRHPAHRDRRMLRRLRTWPD
jgi:hypothetical protein